MSDHRKSMQRQLFATEKELYSESSVSALVYDMQTELFSKECDGDVQFYLDAAGKFARVLDLGTGTGRVAWPMAEAGCSVVGLDVSKEMLKAAKEKRSKYSAATGKRVRFEHGDMANFNLPGTFDLIISPFRSFNHLIGPGEALRCLKKIRRHLRPDGKAVLHLRAYPIEHLDRLGEPPPDSAVPLTFLDGAVLTWRVCRRLIDKENNLFHLGMEFVYRSREGIEERRSQEYWTVRWFDSYEFHDLVRQAGLDVAHEYSDFNCSPPKSEGEQIWVLRWPLRD